MGSFVESRVTALEGLFDHRPPDGLIVAPLFKEGLEGVCDLFQSSFGGGAFGGLSARGFLLGGLSGHLLLGGLVLICKNLS